MGIIVSDAISDIFEKNDYELSRKNTRGSTAPVLKMYNEVTFSVNLVKKKKIPRFLLRAKGEKYDVYIKRVDSFFNTYTKKEIGTVLSHIDPMEEKN